MLRYLRITAAVTSLVACMLLIGLWVRSYWHKTTIISSSQISAWVVGSWEGRLTIIVVNDPLMESGWVFTDAKVQPRTKARIFRKFEWFAHPDEFMVPCWFPVLLTGALAVTLGIRRPVHFSLRTLLIAMTIIAIWLGLISWSI